MKKRTRLLCFILMLSLVIPILSSLPLASSAANTGGNSNEARYTQKIVSVVYDNSGSMRNENRIPAAKYSLSMLMSMLSTEDLLYILPMNDSDIFDVELKDPDRNGVIDTLLNRSEFGPIGGYTPSDSMSKAVSALVSEGLKDQAHLTESDPDKEYWLIILSDGAFNVKSATSSPMQNLSNNTATQAKEVADSVTNYPTLNTVYLSFGANATDISGEKVITDNPKINAYCKVPPSASGSGNLVDVMQKLASQISGRYPLENYSVNGNTVTVDLSKIPFSLASISVIAQNCGTTLKSLKYTTDDGNEVAVTTSKECVISPWSLPGVQAGCSFEVQSSGVIMGGKLELTFHGAIDPNMITIFAEPALSISHYYEAFIDSSWQKVDMQYINAKLGEGKEIKVGYEVREQVNNTVVDLSQVFGDVSAKVHYGSGTSAKTYDMQKGQTDPIPLIIGSNPITVEVSVMDGQYTLRQSDIITVEKYPEYYRVESSGDTVIPKGGTSASAIFTVFIDNKAASRDQLKDYKCSAVASDSAGNTLFTKELSPAADGTMTVKLDVEVNKFDVYSIKFTVVSPENLSREATHDITYAPETFDLKVSGADHISKTQYELETNQDSFTFTLETNGQPFPLTNSVSTYQLLVDGIDMTESASVSGNTLTYTPTKDNLKDIINHPGEKEVKLIITGKQGYDSLSTNTSAKLTIIKTVYTVVPHSASIKDIDRFNLSKTKSVLYFTVNRDGAPISFDELKAIYKNKEIKVEVDKLFKNPFLPAGHKVGIEQLKDDGTAVVTVKVTKDMPTWFEWHFSAFITGGQKDVTVSYGSIKGSDSFNVVDSSLFQHILRITLLILVILYFIHLIIALIGQFIVKPLPSGYLVYISPGYTMISEININLAKTAGLYALWAAIRFLVPFFEFWDQPLWFQDPGLGEYPVRFNRKEGFVFNPSDDDTYYRAALTSAYNSSYGAFTSAVLAGESVDFETFVMDRMRLKKLSLIDVFRKSNTNPLHSDGYYDVMGKYATFGTDFAGKQAVDTFMTFIQI